MSRLSYPATPKTPRTPQYLNTMPPAYSEEETIERCEITARRILRNGFVIEHLHAMTSVQIGAENNTGFVLIMSAGNRAVDKVEHTRAGIKEGILDIAGQGCELASPYLPANFLGGRGATWKRN
ncbi:hypothetical protein F4808DRAFT_98417 [Astrocystis sublimbata]|nr:hypothetical protein F4808DRAFT_98417 [Astrocystis sublimbata]